MKFATLSDGTPDGRLLVVSRDLSSAAPAGALAKNLLSALENWHDVRPALEELYSRVNDGSAPELESLAAEKLTAPLPRTWQWLDASVYKSHGDLCTHAFGLKSVWYERPLMYQGMSHEFWGPNDPAIFPSEEDGIDFEGEVGVITTAVPMGVSSEAAGAHIALLTQINDWSLRYLVRDEMTRGFGWLRGKPACTLAPIAITPDELGDAWSGSTMDVSLQIWRDEQLFGRANAKCMAFGFDELIAHAAYSRGLPAGTVIGSGTIANENASEVGSSCILERRGIELIETGDQTTPFLKAGEQVRMTAVTANGEQPFGSMSQIISVQRELVGETGK